MYRLGKFQWVRLTLAHRKKYRERKSGLLLYVQVIWQRCHCCNHNILRFLVSLDSTMDVASIETDVNLRTTLQKETHNESSISDIFSVQTCTQPNPWWNCDTFGKLSACMKHKLSYTTYNVTHYLTLWNSLGTCNLVNIQYLAPASEEPLLQP